MNDFCGREARILSPQDVVATGKYRFRYYHTPQLPHGWDAGLLFEETQRTLFCSDLFHQQGDIEPLAHSSIIDRCRQALANIQASPLANYVPHTPNTRLILEGLASLKPQTLAVQHGSSFAGDGGAALLALSTVMQELLSEASYNFPT